MRDNNLVDGQPIPTQVQEEEGEDADNWLIDVLWEARNAIERADLWDNRAFF